MKKNILVGCAVIACSLMYAPGSHAQAVKEYVEDAGIEKIEKSVVIDGQPVTAKGFGDGHGKMPLFTKKSQLPDTVALITLYIYDLGTHTTSRGGHTVFTTYTSVSKSGGNTLANEIYKNSIANLKQAFLKQGVVLLTPEEFLNTPAKKAFYYKEFTPQVSKLGDFLGGLENKNTDIAVGADNFRVFDIAMSTDFLRSESLGADLTKKLGVKGVLSIAVELQSSKRSLDLHGFKVSLHGPNPVPKEDKKYVAQKMGNGYYNGQLYAHATMFFKSPIEVGSFKKSDLESVNFDGVGVALEAIVNKVYKVMNENTETAAKKYD